MDDVVRRLISDAARATELFSEDDLERFAAETRKEEKGG